MTLVKISDPQDAKQFLRSVGLTVPEEVVLRVAEVVRGKVKRSIYSLWHGNKRFGEMPVCAKGTVTKIRKLYEAGKLKPYLDYLDGGATVQPASDQVLESRHMATHGSRVNLEGSTEAAPQTRVHNLQALNLDALREAMWVPSPEHVPVGQFGSQTAEIVAGRLFRCTRSGEKVVRCWVTQMEEKLLCSIIPQVCPGEIGRDMLRRYAELQARMCSYILDVTAYVMDYEFGGGRVWFGDLRNYGTLERLEVARRHPYECGDGLILIETSEGLKGEVDALLRDLRLCLPASVGAASTFDDEPGT